MIPKGVQFKNVKPMGVFQEFRDYTVTPVQTYTNIFNTNDIVRFQFNLQDWYIDPYESYIEAEVGLPSIAETTDINLNNLYYPAQNSIAFYMMDGPSTSLINDFRFEVNSKEIERIREYDQVGNLLQDLNMYPSVVDQKDFEGYYSINNPVTITQQNNYQSYNQVYALSTTAVGFSQNKNNNIFNGNILNSSTIQYSSTNYFVRPQNNDFGDNGINIGTVNEISIQDNQQKTLTAPCSNIVQNVIKAKATDANAFGQLHQMYGDGTFLGQLTQNNSNFGIFSDDTTSFIKYNPCKQSPKLNQQDGHNIFLTNLPTTKIQNGKFVKDITDFNLNTSDYAQTRAYMQIPLLSGILGVLIPSDRWQLIPSNSLGQVNMEFRFNPNAFFSHDGSQPVWVVHKFQLRLRMYKFDNALQNQLKAQVNSGIQMHSQIFSMGPIYNIQPNVSVTNNWQLNNGIPSIKQLFFWFLSNDYEVYNHARKNFKLSHNITSMQLKLGSNYIPQNPIIGHAGNIIRNAKTPQDNSVYLSELQQAMNVLFDCKKHFNINKLNFAINERPYDVTGLTVQGVTAGSTSTTNYIQQAKQYGYLLYEEMRCRGKAVYAFNLEADKKNDDTLTGMDTTKLRPIELILKSEDPNTFQRASTMYVMFLSDFIVSFKGDTVDTEGQG